MKSKPIIYGIFFIILIWFVYYGNNNDNPSSSIDQTKSLEEIKSELLSYFSEEIADISEFSSSTVWVFIRADIDEGNTPDLAARIGNYIASSPHNTFQITPSIHVFQGNTHLAEARYSISTKIYYGESKIETWK